MREIHQCWNDNLPFAFILEINSVRVSASVQSIAQNVPTPRARENKPGYLS